MRVALVHDYFTQLGGAERVVGRLASILEPAVIASSMADPRLLPPELVGRIIRTTPLQVPLRAGIPLAAMAPLLPLAFGRLDVGPVDVVVSSTSAFAHHVAIPAGAAHVAYVHTPARFIWHSDAYFRETPWQRQLLSPALDAFRRLDRRAIRRVDRLVANSRYTAARLERLHGRPAEVVYPPVDVASFRPRPDRSGRFLVVARLRPYKRIDLAIAAAARLGAPLDIIGSGPDLARLRALAGPGVRFLGRLDDAAVADAMATCEALVVPAAEDFGLTMVEVQAAGRPPVALAAGGALEIVEDGRTGALAPEQTIEALAEAMDRARSLPGDPEPFRAAARRFDASVFAGEMGRIVHEMGPGRRIGRDRAHAGAGAAAPAEGMA